MGCYRIRIGGALGTSPSVPDEFRKLAEKDLRNELQLELLADLEFPIARPRGR